MPTDQLGFAWIIKFRIGAVLLGPDLVQLHKLPTCFKYKCPCCLANTAETLEQIVLQCTKWEQLRMEHLRTGLRKVDQLVQRAPRPTEIDSEACRLSWLLGGSCDDF